MIRDIKTLGELWRYVDRLNHKYFPESELRPIHGGGKSSSAALPDSPKIKLFLPLLEKEIEIVKPKYIVSFWQIPTEKLIGQKINLGDYYNEIVRKKRLKFFRKRFDVFETKIIPCYFPIGRGNPKKAIEVLKLLTSQVDLVGRLVRST